MTASPKRIVDVGASALNREQKAALKAGKCPCHEPWRDGLCVICLLRRAQGQPSGAAYAALSDEEQADLAAWMFNNPLTRLSGGSERDGAAFREIDSHGGKRHGTGSATSGVNALPAKKASRVDTGRTAREEAVS